jgi:hypothetical protein
MRWLWMVIAIVVVASALCVTAFFIFLKKKPYVAVYLATGDIYYGKMTCFPKFTLTDALFLQRGADGNLGLQKLSDAFWKPKGPMVIERDQIVFWSELDPSSPVVSAIEGRPLPQEMQQAPVNNEPTVPDEEESPAEITE